MEYINIIGMLPTKEEIKKEADSYDNHLASMSESVWMPKGFKAGANWVINNLKEKLDKQ